MLGLCRNDGGIRSRRLQQDVGCLNAAPLVVSQDLPFHGQIWPNARLSLQESPGIRLRVDASQGLHAGS